MDNYNYLAETGDRTGAPVRYQGPGADQRFRTGSKGPVSK